MINMVNADIIEFCKNYDGELFHGVFCDPPYHLTSITERFGKNGSAPAKDKDGLFQRASRGFLGKEWDGGDIAFDPETWKAIGNLMLPGAFGLAFSATRNYHRMATAIEDAGFLIHPMIVWINGQGFPKATNPEKLLNKREDDRAEIFEGYRYGAQALKPVVEPICVFQKPWEEDNQLDNILKYGTGLYDIDGSRIGTNEELKAGGSLVTNSGDERIGKALGMFQKGTPNTYVKNDNGRWPAGLILQHTPDCKVIGYRDDSYQINRFDNGAKPWGDAVGEEFIEHKVEGKTPVYECVEGCPVRSLDEQTGELKSGAMKKHYEYKNNGVSMGAPAGETRSIHDANSGGASRFFYQAHYNLEQSDPFIYQAKASKSEKNAGLDAMEDKIYAQSGGAPARLASGEEEYKQDSIGMNRIRKVKNNHPTVKPIDLTRYLAGLILPPKEYSPRRILIPFAGTGSEAIGAFLAGWDEITAVELEEEYVEIGNARIEHWCNLDRQLDLF
jgi:DNA modification methylase